MSEFILHWIIALAAFLLILTALYLVIRMAVRGAMKDAFQELGKEIAQKVWDDEEEQG